MIEFESPILLYLLLLIPIIIGVLRYSLVDSSRGQLAASTAVRVSVFGLLVLALAGATWITQGRDLAVMVLVDQSASVPEEAAAETTALLNELEEALPGSAQAGVITFGETPTTALTLQSSPPLSTLEASTEAKESTNIESALHLASQVMSANTLNRVVVLSDGNETHGDGLAAVKRAAKRGIRVYTVPYSDKKQDEVLLEELHVPTEVKKGQSFSIIGVAKAVSATKATFSLYRNGFLLDAKEMELKEGNNSVTFQETEAPEGLTKYELHITADKDFYADNNIASGIVFVEGEPRILLLEGEEREARYLTRALEAEGINVEVREGKGMPARLEELATFDAVLMSDVPATDLSMGQMNILKSYVEDLGGGFIMLGGEESYGLGGYYRSPVEDILPVKMRSERKKDEPSIALMLIIDKSGSMGGVKMDLAREAAISALELLGPRDYIGVIAFDGQAYWAVPLQSASNRSMAIGAIESIAAGGGTNMYPGLVEANDALMRTPAAIKHAIALTDGHSQGGDFNGIVDRMRGQNVTVSTVAVGQGAGTELLQDIARWGRGRFYFTTDPFDIPQIFTKETMQASKSSLIEEPFLAQVFSSQQTVQSIDWATSPFLFGYVSTTPKSTADIALVSERGDPLLATWRVGLGRTAAWTSDAKSRWASDWLRWPGYGQFWSQLVRDVMRQTQNMGNETAITIQGGEGQLVVDSVDINGNFMNGLITEAQLIAPNQDVITLALKQTAPGRYESDFDAETIGGYLFRIKQLDAVSTDEEGQEALTNYTRGVTVSYQPEYRHIATNEPYLESMAQVSDGEYNPTIEELLEVGKDESVPVRKRLWPWLLSIALILFLGDVALRRLDLAR